MTHIPDHDWASSERNEHIWDIIGRRVQDRIPPVQTLNELEQVLHQEWQRLTHAHIRRLVGSMRRRLAEVIHVNGSYTTYLHIYTPGKKYCNTPIFLLVKLCDARVLFLTEMYYKFDSNASNWITGTKQNTFTITKNWNLMVAECKTEYLRFKLWMNWSRFCTRNGSVLPMHKLDG
jgi:hypothetical protein